MPVQITIRDVPEAVRNELAARAARRGQSMQQYLAGQLQRIAALPTAEDLMQAAKNRLEFDPANVSVKAILDARDADRK